MVVPPSRTHKFCRGMKEQETEDLHVACLANWATYTAGFGQFVEDDHTVSVSLVLNDDAIAKLVSFNEDAELPQGLPPARRNELNEAQWVHLNELDKMIKKLNWLKYDTLAPKTLLPVGPSIKEVVDEPGSGAGETVRPAKNPHNFDSLMSLGDEQFLNCFTYAPKGDPAVTARVALERILKHAKTYGPLRALNTDTATIWFRVASILILKEEPKLPDFFIKPADCALHKHLKAFVSLLSLDVLKGAFEGHWNESCVQNVLKVIDENYVLVEPEGAAPSTSRKRSASAQRDRPRSAGRGRPARMQAPVRRVPSLVPVGVPQAVGDEVDPGAYDINQKADRMLNVIGTLSLQVEALSNVVDGRATESDRSAALLLEDKLSFAMSALKLLIMDAKSAGPTPMLMAAKMLMATKVRGQPAFTQEALDELFGA